LKTDYSAWNPWSAPRTNAKYVNNVTITILKSVSLLVHSYCLTQVPGLVPENNAIAEGKNLCRCRLSAGVCWL